MKPVDQTVLGDKGNCMQACIATLLELPLEHVPDFCNLYAVDEWHHELSAWLRQRGHAVLAIRAPEPEAWFQGMALEAPHTPWIACARTERGLLHAVIYVGGKLAHDPHPSRAGIDERTLQSAEYVIPLSYGVTDAHRLAVFKELIEYQYRNGQTHMDQALYAFEREVKARMGAET